MAIPKNEPGISGDSIVPNVGPSLAHYDNPRANAGLSNTSRPNLAQTPLFNKLIIVCGLLSLVSIFAGRAVWAWYTDPFRGTTLPDYSTSAVQLIGRTINLPLLDDKNRPIPRDRRLLLAPAPCGSCTQPKHWIESVQSAASTPIVVLLPSRDEVIETALERRPASVYLVRSSRSDDVYRLLNDIAPGFAATDATRKIVAVSDTSESTDVFMKRARLK